MFTKWPIYCLTDNNVESLKVSLIEWSSDNIIYEINPRNTNVDDLSFNGDERLIARRKIYGINDDIVFRLNDGLRFYVWNNQM